MVQAKVAVIGSGIVGQVLAEGFLKHGYAVVRASREPAKMKDWQLQAGPNAEIDQVSDAVKAASLVVLAVKGRAAEATIELCGADNLAGKVVIDATNPIREEPPQGGVLRFFTNLDESLMERLQARAPQARFVKAFSCVGNAQMVNPDYGGLKPTMFICGNDADAKAQVGTILERFGWESEDMGGAEAARAIEPLCMLWCIPGFLRNQWGHAFKLLK